MEVNAAMHGWSELLRKKGEYMKKITSLVLVMSLLLSIISIPAAAAESKETEQVTTNDSVAAIEGKFPTTFDY